MSLKAREPEIRQHGPRCSLCVAIDRMAPEERIILDGWLADRRYTGRTITLYLADGGYPEVAENAVQSHRRGDCWHMRHAQ